MTKYMQIVDTQKEDSVVVCMQDPIFVMMSDRKDFDILKKQERAHYPGIYLLIGKDNLYVGQSGTDMSRRLYSHNRTKEWWDTVIMFGREDRQLSKAQTDYLERTLIDLYDAASDAKDNGNHGNKSYISNIEKLKADQIWEVAQEIILDILNVEALKLTGETVSLFEAPSDISKYSIAIKQNGKVVKTVEGTSLRRTVVNAIAEIETLAPDKFQMVMIQGAPRSKETDILGTEQAFSPKGQALATKIHDGLYIYSNFSRNTLSRLLDKFGPLVGYTFTITTHTGTEA